MKTKMRKIDGRKLRKAQNALGIGPAVVCNEADVSMSTLYKIYSNKPVSFNSANRVKKAIDRLKEKVWKKSI